ncbi:MAG: PD-(D/E)XK nuclease family protein [Brevinema sp.]
MQFILGNFGVGKTSYIKQEVLSLLKNKKPFLIIVPSRQHKDQLLLELLQAQQGLIGTPIITLTEFQKRLLDALFPTENSQTLSNFEKFLIISSISTQNANRFSAFKNIQQRPELIKMIYRLIHSLRDKDIEYLDSTSELKDKIEDLQLILSEYHRILKEKNLVDSKLEIDQICQVFSQLDPNFFPDYIYIDGFVDLTAGQFKLIQHTALFLEQHNKKFCMTLTDSSHSISQQTILHFKKSFPHANYLVLPNQVNIADVFLKDNSPIPSQLEFYEIQAFGKSREVEYIVNQIKKLCLNDNYSLKDILLITTHQDQYAPLLISALRKAKIPFAFGKDDKLSQNPLIIFLKRCLKLMTETINHESIEFFAQSNYVKKEFRNLWSNLPALVPFGVDGKTEIWTQVFQDIANNSPDITNNEIGESIKLLCSKLFALDPYAPYLISELIQHITNVIEFLGLQESLSDTSVLITHKEIIEQSIAKDYSALLKLKEIFQGLQKSLERIGQTHLNLINFIFSFNMILEETRYRSKIPQKNILHILNPNDTRGLFVKAVFILGLNESEFPSSPKLDLFDNFDRNRLNTLSKKILGMPLWSTEIDYFNEQKLNFAVALSRATQKLYFSRTPVNEKGVYFNSSYFLQRILKKDITHTKIPHTNNPDLIDNPSIFLKKHLVEEYFEPSLLNFLKKNGDPSISEAYQYIQMIQQANDDFENNILPDPQVRSYFGFIPSITHITKKYLSAEVVVSPTRLEKIGRCRYQGLWQDFWKLKPYQLPSYKPEAADYGNLYHKVLELYIPQYIEFNPENLHHVLQQCVQDSQQANLFTLDYQYIYLTLSGFLQKIEPKLREQQSPKYVELYTGHEELSNPEVSLSSHKTLKVYSRIDRVDYNTINDSYSVIDYKKGSITSYKEYQKIPFNLFQGFLYSALLIKNKKTPIQDVSYIFLEKQEIFQEYPGIFNKKPLYQSIQEFQYIKHTEITQLLQLLGEGNFSPFTLDSDIGSELQTIFEEKFGEKFTRENPLKCAYCDLHKICLRKHKKVKTL